MLLLAGNTAVHPHVCGERLGATRICAHEGGSSPRVWGTGMYKLCSFLFLRFIPTCVGNGQVGSKKGKVTAVHPHVCGERANALLSAVALYGSSPRVWGTDFP